MYIRIPLQALVNDTILNKPINQDGKTIGTITHYDDKYIYGVIWVRASIQSNSDNYSFKVVNLHSPWDKEKGDDKWILY